MHRVRIERVAQQQYSQAAERSASRLKRGTMVGSCQERGWGAEHSRTSWAYLCGEAAADAQVSQAIASLQSRVAADILDTRRCNHLGMHWDFSDLHRQRDSLTLIRMTRPAHVIGVQFFLSRGARTRALRAPLHYGAASPKVAPRACYPLPSSLASSALVVFPFVNI